MIPQKREIVVNRVRGTLSDVIGSAEEVINNRLKDADEHIAELKQLSSKNVDVISHIMYKVQSEKSSLETDMQRYQALRSIYTKETGKLVRLLNPDRLEKLIAITKHNMARCATSLTLQKTISKYFERLNQYIDSAIEQSSEIASLCENITRDFEEDHGISNFSVRRLRLEKFQHEIARLEAKHSDLKTTRTLFFREQMSITNRFYESVCNASRKIFSGALKDATNWNNNLMVPMETHVREHHTQLRRRLESVKRIHKASDTVETRLKELTIMQERLHDQNQQFNGFTTTLTQLLESAEAANAAKEKTVEQESEQKESADILMWNHKVNF